ncbi:uncharacterized protein [Palaemon carinicauda]|uniref:uncharacterized protein n=1 Tax=Palaemon carinicauda TaxID=392227 RepID=UPI0035B5B5BF
MPTYLALILLGMVSMSEEGLTCREPGTVQDPIIASPTRPGHVAVIEKRSPRDTSVQFSGMSVSDGRKSVASSSVTKKGKTKAAVVSSQGGNIFDDFFGANSQSSLRVSSRSASVRQRVGP